MIILLSPQDQAEIAAIYSHLKTMIAPETEFTLKDLADRAERLVGLDKAGKALVGELFAQTLEQDAANILVAFEVFAYGAYEKDAAGDIRLLTPLDVLLPAEDHPTPAVGFTSTKDGPTVRFG